MADYTARERAIDTLVPVIREASDLGHEDARVAAEGLVVVLEAAGIGFHLVGKNEE